MLLKIKKFSYSLAQSHYPDAVKIILKIEIRSDYTHVDTSHTLRAFVEGENLRGEPVQLVVQEHLYLKPCEEKTVLLEAPLFYPVRSCDKNSYEYSVILKLITNPEEKVIITERYALLIPEDNAEVQKYR